jgi:hypothetical protein
MQEGAGGSLRGLAVDRPREEGNPTPFLPFALEGQKIVNVSRENS